MKYLVAILVALVATTSTQAATVPAHITLPKGYEYDYINFQPITGTDILLRLLYSPQAFPGHIYVCTGKNYTGVCGYQTQQLDTCFILQPPFLHNIGSFGVDRGVLRSPTYSEANCTRGEGFIQYPGEYNMRNYTGESFIGINTPRNSTNAIPATDIDDEINSFSCEECTNCQ